MKLAIICRPFVFHGGLERATAGLVAELVGRGIDVHLLTTRGQVEWPGVTVHRLPLCPTPSLARLLTFTVSASRAAKSGGYDLVQSHERTLTHDLFRAGEGCHRAWLEIKAARLSLGARALLYANPYHRALLALERRIFSPGHSRRLIAISRLGSAEIQRLYGAAEKEIAVVYNGVDLGRFSPEQRSKFRREVRRAYGIPEDAVLVLFVGSGFERKGLDTLIRALARADDRTARLAVVGKGNIAPYRALASSVGVDARIHWVGPRQDVEQVYAAGDLVALPTRYEPFGNVHLEALASGLPVIASSRSGGAEILTPGRNGVVLNDPEDPVELASAIDLLAEPSRSRRWEDAARATAERFTYASQVDQLFAIYREVGKPP